ncbi:MAG: sulfatase-like hydrolase/transferase [Acidobacteriota bacterium]|nr:sulfatase-like hydrolase/transferase [Acidobacteriota bacterium]
MDRRDFLKTAGIGAAGIGAAALGLPGMGWSQAGRKPNIIVILADDLGYGELSVQGCQDIPTPNIDSIAAAGVRFTDGYVSCPVCAPTRAGLLTGRYQQRFGLELNPGPQQQADPDYGLPTDQPTIAERLKGLGYATGMVGKWHLGYNPGGQPSQRGFDEFFGFLGGANGYLADKRPADSILRGTEVVPEPEYLTDAFGREAVAFIEAHPNDPFFLYLPFNAVHSPLQAPDKYLERFAHTEDEKRRTFAAMMAAMDDNVGRVLDTVRRLNLEEDTLIFFLGDNGGPTPQTTSGNGRLRGTKGQTYEGGIRVPFLAQWKGHIPAGQVFSHPTIALDIHPTAVAAAGGTVAAHWNLDGVNLMPALTGASTAQPHESLFWRFSQQRAIRQGDWKLVRGPQSQAWELYNLADDIGETTDLAAAQPDKAKKLLAAFEAWDAENIEPRWKGRTPAAGGGGRRQNTAARRFRQLDKNGDGKVTGDEVGRPRLFGQMDADGDGTVTRAEMREFLAKRQAEQAGQAE